MHRTIAVKAPAKLNLSLDILGLRHDGYHFMKMLMQTVDIFDDITIETGSGGGITLDCDFPELDTGASNLAVRAAQAFCGATGFHREGMRIRLEKRIPLQAGLAGGSADAAGVLVGLNALLERPMASEELCMLGAQLGADVPFCIVGGTLLAEGIGEVLTPLPSLPSCAIVVAKPDTGVSTASAFTRYDAESWQRQRPDTDSLISAIVTGDLAQLAAEMRNVLEDPKDVQTAGMKALMREQGALGAMLTGSGSAVFGIFESRRRAAKCQSVLAKELSFAAVCAPCGGPVIME